MFRQILSIFYHSNIIFTIMFVAIPFCCLGATYDMTVGESRSFSPFNNTTKYRNAVLAYMSLSDDNAFEVTSSLSPYNDYNITYKLKALKTGTYKVTFSIQYKDVFDYVWDNFTYTLNVHDVTSITIPSTISLIIGEKYTYSPIIEDNKAKTTIEWSSDNPAIVSVDGPTITAKSIGSAIITCKAHNGVKATSLVSVSPVLVNSISLNFQEYDLPIFNKLHLSAVVSPSNAANPHIQWLSSNNNIAIVREDGIVVGVNCGYALISAKAMDTSGISASCLVHVVDVPNEEHIISISDSECGKIEIRFDETYSIRPIPNEGWRMHTVINKDGTILSSSDEWITLSNLDIEKNLIIIWENISTSLSAQLANSNIFRIYNRTISFIDDRFKHLGISNIQGRVLYQGPCQNIQLPYPGCFIVNIDDKIFKIYIP